MLWQFVALVCYWYSVWEDWWFRKPSGSFYAIFHAPFEIDSLPISVPTTWYPTETQQLQAALRMAVEAWSCRLDASKIIVTPPQLVILLQTESSLLSLEKAALIYNVPRFSIAAEIPPPIWKVAAHDLVSLEFRREEIPVAVLIRSDFAKLLPRLEGDFGGEIFWNLMFPQCVIGESTLWLKTKQGSECIGSAHTRFVVSKVDKEYVFQLHW